MPAPATGPSATSRQVPAEANAARQGWPRICLVGPLPPPSGGMANQCEQLLRLLHAEGAQAELVRTNAPYQPSWVGHVPLLRAVFRLLPYSLALWRAAARAQVMHIFANSGWSWHLFAAPALWMAHRRGVATIVNYRGGQADEFFSADSGGVLRALGGASLRVTPSHFLQRVFKRHGLDAEIIPNIIDLSRFEPTGRVLSPQAPHLIVTRNLEAIYDIPTALRAFALVRNRHGGATLTVAGSGPLLGELQALVTELGLADCVRFAGRIDNAQIGRLYAQADLVLNPSTADNMPISILESLASGVPVVTTNAGGIPDLVEHERTALMVPVGDAHQMADAALRLIADTALRERLRSAGLHAAQGFAWTQVRPQWQAVYQRLAAGTAR